jgi:hypothetical protein
MCYRELWEGRWKENRIKRKGREEERGRRKKEGERGRKKEGERGRKKEGKEKKGKERREVGREGPLFLILCREKDEGR